MIKKKIFQLALILILFNYIFLTINVVGVDYNLGINENDTFIWKIEELDDDEYENIFITEAGFDKDDQKKIEIVNIEETTDKWRITYYIWDYTDDTNDFSEEADDDKTKKLYKDPEEQAEKIIDLENFARMWIVPSPFTNYIEEFRDEHDNAFFDVFVDGDMLIMKPAVENAEYEIEITYGNDGVAEKIEYVDDDGNTFLKIILLEETIPGYDVLLIYGLILICGIISVIIWKKKLNFNDI